MQILCFFSENDPMAIEKANLLSILKLVIKEVIESSMKYAQQLDSDFLPVQHFFIVMEHILRHGFKDKKVSNEKVIGLIIVVKFYFH